jgi:hypothetical protein
MSRNRAFVIVGIALVLGVLGVASAGASDRGDRSRERGFVLPCSLDGVNPSYHPDIFGNPAVARSFGFVQGPDHVWHVVSGCRRY